LDDVQAEGRRLMIDADLLQESLLGLGIQ
jgi:hypothetical protein